MIASRPWLWLCGPSGVGKSSVGWELHRQLGQDGQDGVDAAFVDADQLGLCYPEPPDDPDNHRLKSRNLAALWPHLRAAGAGRLLLAGIVQRKEDVRLYADQLPDASLTLCRLRVDLDELTARFTGRGTLLHLLEENLREAEELDRAGFGTVRVDTDGRSAEDVAAEISQLLGA